MANGNSPAADSPDQISNLDQLSQLIMRLPRAGGSPIDSLVNSPAPTPRLAAQPTAPAQPQPAISPRMGTSPDALRTKMQTAAAAAPTASPAASPATSPVATSPNPNPPSDDPLISYRSALDQSNKNLQDMIAQESATRGKIAAVPTVNPQDYKPKWYDRLLGAGEGFFEGYGRGNAARGAEAGAALTHRGLTRAQAQRQATLGPLLEQLNAEREEVPLLTEAQKSASEQLTGAINTEKEKSEADYRKSRAGYYEQRSKEVGDKFISGSEKQDPNSPTGWVAETFNGDTKPFTPKALEKPTQEPKTEVEVATAYRDALAKGDKDTAAKYKGVLDLLAKQKAAGKDTSAADLAKAIEVAEFRLRESDKVNQDKETERNKRYSDLEKNVTLKYSPDQMANEKAKIDQELETKYAPRVQKIDDQADEMLGLTKAGRTLKESASASTVAKGDVTPQSSMWRDKTKALRVKQPSGAIQLWQLENGTPKLVKTEQPAKGQ